MAKISVIIPTWNRAHIIEKAIQSVLSQTVPVSEILVCDDGSTDNTLELIHSLTATHPNIRWIPGKRGGRPAIPRNRGIKAAGGDWLAFLDSDDYWLPHKLEEQLNLLTDRNLRAVCSNAFRYLPGEGITTNLLDWDKPGITFADLLTGNLVICSSALIHRSLIDSAVGFPENPNLTALEDYAFWLRITVNAEFGYLNEPLLVYLDDPQKSLRGTATQDVELQRKYVFRDLMLWGKRQKIAPELLAQIKNCYQKSLFKSIFK